MKNFQALYDAGAVQRWHTWPTIKSQNLAEHSWGVAMTILKIWPEATVEFIEAALTHDLHEVEAGDIPYPFKKNNEVVRDAYEDQEEDFQERHELASPTSELQLKILKWADMYELLLYTTREFQMGNQKMAKTMNVARDALIEMGHPTPQARALFEETV